MTRVSIRHRLVLLIALVLMAGPVRAEQVVRFVAAPDKSSVCIDGTSTLHDWTAKSPSIAGHIDFKFDVPAAASAVAIREAIVAKPKASVEATIEVKSLKSGKRDMDKKMYEALQHDTYPTINYELSSLSLPRDANAQQEEFKIETTGNLTVAGITREVQIPMTLRVVDAQHLKITGEISMKMTDFKVEPPEALFGVIKSGDAIDVRFEWNTVRQDASEKIDRRNS